MSALKIALLIATYSQFSANDGVDLEPIALPPVQEIGIASWYGDGNWHGDMTANGETFNPDRYTCAHRTLPFDTTLLVVNRANRRRIWCRINDRGPFGASLPDGTWGLRLSPEDHGTWRGIIDLSVAAAQALGTTETGLAQVELRYWEKNSNEIFNLASIDLQYP